MEFNGQSVWVGVNLRFCEICEDFLYIFTFILSVFTGIRSEKDLKRRTCRNRDKEDPRVSSLPPPSRNTRLGCGWLIGDSGIAVHTL